MQFIGRQAQIDTFTAKRQAQQGGIFAIQGGPGLGKSTLLNELAQCSTAAAQPAWFLDLEELETQSPGLYGLTPLGYWIAHPDGLPHTENHSNPAR